MEISPKTALQPAVDSSAVNFAGNPDPNHSGFLAIAQHFDAVLLFTVQDSKTLSFFLLPFEAS